MENFARTKLIATYGPSLDKEFAWDFSNKPTKLTSNQVKFYKQLYYCGVNVIRFNMSHDSLVNHSYRLQQFRNLMKTTGLVIGIMIDTKGPEIRVGEIQKKVNSENLINSGQIIKLVTNKKIIGNKNSFSVGDGSGSYNLANDLKIDDEILIDDGKLVLKVKSISKDKNEITTVSLTNNYLITSNKRVNLFNKKYSLPFLSNYDIVTIQWAAKQNVDYLALSFISNIDELRSVLKIINEVNTESDIKIICKIETPEAVTNLSSLVENTDGIMVARGDLSLGIGYEKVPFIQDEIINLCNKYNKISIVATQMLDSLETKMLPTRAEVTDCYYATKSCSDATMLSSESAAGLNPINAIEVMKKITNYAEFKFSHEINFSALYFQTKLIKRIIKKINNKTLENPNILLKGFSEIEIRQISNILLNKHFYLDPQESQKPSKFTLYKNINFITKNTPNNLYLLTKK